MTVSITKRCTKCGEIKHEFPVSKKMRDGASSHCVDCKRKYDREFGVKYRKENLEKTHLATKRWAENNPDKVREKSRNWQRKHKDVRKEWAKNNKDRIRELARESWKKNREKNLAKLRNYRYSKRTTGKVTSEEWKEILEKYGSKCLYPGCNETKVEMDHVVPIKLGGTHTADNIQPLCRHHNASKSAKIEDYRNRQ